MVCLTISLIAQTIYVAPVHKATVRKAMGRICKEAAVIKLQELSQDLPARTTEDVPYYSRLGPRV
jgi:hypothetical protein